MVNFYPLGLVLHLIHTSLSFLFLRKSLSQVTVVCYRKIRHRQLIDLNSILYFISGG